MLFTREHGDVNAKLQVRQDLQKFYHDRSSKELSKLYPGYNVPVFNPVNQKWQPGMVREETQTPKSYVVDMESGNTLVRNRRHIRQSIESVVDFPDQFQDTTDDVSVVLSSPVNEYPSSPMTEEKTQTPKLRRSTRIRKCPDKLNL